MEVLVFFFSTGNNFTYKEFIKNFHSLHDLKSKQYLLKENLLILNEENENITKRYLELGLM